MIQYSNRPPEDARGPAFPIRRTPSTKPLVAIVTSEELLGCATHWWKGRTVPCEAPDCEACREQIPWRWHGYLAAYNPDSHEHFIFEMTAQAADTFVEYFDKYSTLRGAHFEAVRLDRRPNGRVRIRCGPADLQKITLPKSPSLEKALSILWNLQKSKVSIAPRPPHIPKVDRRIDPDSDAEPKHVLEYVKAGGNSPAAATQKPKK